MPSSSLEAIRKSRRKWYHRNSEHAKAKVKERKQICYQWLREYKNELKCETCGESNPACLDFHHTDPTTKEYNIAQICSSGWSQKRMLSEINKCIVLCANCHRKLHALDVPVA